MMRILRKTIRRFAVALLAVVAAMPLSAITVDDLDGKLVCQIFQSTVFTQKHWNYGTWGMFEKVEGSTNQLRLTNFYNCQDVLFKLTDDGWLELDGVDSKDGVSATDADGNGLTMQLMECVPGEDGAEHDYIMLRYQPYDETGLYGYKGQLRVGDINNKEDFDYVVTLRAYENESDDEYDYPNALMFRYHTAADRSSSGLDVSTEAGASELAARRQRIKDDYMRTFPSARLYIMTPNDYMEFGSQRIPVRIVNKVKDGTYYLITYNLGGFGWDYYFDGSVQYVDGGYCEVIFDPSTGKITVPANPISSRTTRLEWEPSSETTTTFYNINKKGNGKFDTSTYMIGSYPYEDSPKAFYGSYSGTLTRHADGVENRWDVKDGGDLRTVEEAALTLDSWAVSYQSSTTTPVQTFEKSSVVFESDVTHDVSLNVNSVSMSEAGLRVEGFIAPVAYDNYVGSYDLMVVPGDYSSISDVGFSCDGDVGCASALALDATYDYVAPATDAATLSTVRRSAINAASFDKLLPSSVITDKNWPETAGGYTFFVRTNYTADSGLAPSFHLLTPPTRTVTGVCDAFRSPELYAKAVAGGIEISGVSKADIVNASGVKVAAGVFGRVSLSPGIYIVISGGQARKVVVGGLR